MAATILQRQLAGYQYMLAVPGLAFAGSFGVVDTARSLCDAPWRRGLGWHLCSAAALVALATLLVRDAATWWRAYSPDLSHLEGRLARSDYLHAIQVGRYSTTDEEQAASWLREHTAPADGILVWGLSPGEYALADRHPVTRFPFHKILLTDAPLSRMWPGLSQRREAFMAQIEREQPAYILVGRGDQNGFEPLDSQTSLMRFRELRQFVQGGYETETTIGHFVVLRRLQPSTSLPQRGSESR